MKYGEHFNRPDWDRILMQNIPEHMQSGIVNYILHGVIPGGFLHAVLSNDFMSAGRQADVINSARLWNYTNFLHNAAPAQCFGSPQAVADWINAGGALGLRTEREEK